MLYTRGREILVGGLGKAFPQEKARPHQATQYNTLRCKGTTWHFQKSPSTGTRDKHFLWFLLKEEKVEEHIKSSTQGCWDNERTGCFAQKQHNFTPSQWLAAPRVKQGSKTQGALRRPHLPPHRGSCRNVSALPRHLIRGKTLLPVPTCRNRFSGQGL